MRFRIIVLHTLILFGLVALPYSTTESAGALPRVTTPFGEVHTDVERQGAVVIQWKASMNRHPRPSVLRSVDSERGDAVISFDASTTGVLVVTREQSLSGIGGTHFLAKVRLDHLLTESEQGVRIRTKDQGVMIAPLVRMFRVSPQGFDPGIAVVAGGVEDLPTVLIRFHGLVSVWEFSFEKPTGVGIPMTKDSKWRVIGTCAATGGAGDPFHAFLWNGNLVVIDGKNTAYELDLDSLELLEGGEPILSGTEWTISSNESLPERLEALPRWTPSRQWTLDEPVHLFHKDVETGRVVLKGAAGEVVLEELLDR